MWATLLCLAIYITIAALVFSEASGYVACQFDPAEFCGPTKPSALPLILVANFLAPVVLLI